MVVLCWGTFLRALLECRIGILKIHRKNTWMGIREIKTQRTFVGIDV